MDTETNTVDVSKEASFETAVANDAAKKNKNVKWEKLAKYTQWKLFKAYMHEKEITDGNLFKRMKSLISEKKTDAFVTYSITEQKVTDVDFKHEVFIRERSKKKKLLAQVAQAQEQEKLDDLELRISGLSVLSDNIEIIEEVEVSVSDS
jgi:hypothetical protein